MYVNGTCVSWVVPQIILLLVNYLANYWLRKIKVRKMHSQNTKFVVCECIFLTCASKSCMDVCVRTNIICCITWQTNSECKMLKCIVSYKRKEFGAIHIEISGVL